MLAESVSNAGDEVSVEYETRSELLRYRSRAEFRAVQFGPWIPGASEVSDPAFFGEGRDRNLARVNRLAPNPADRLSRTVRYAHSGFSGLPDVAQQLPVTGRGLGTGYGRWQIWLMSKGLPRSRGRPVSRLSTRGQWLRAGVIAMGALLVGGLGILGLNRRRQRTWDSRGGNDAGLTG